VGRRSGSGSERLAFHRAPSALAGQCLDGPDAPPQRIQLAIAEGFEGGDDHQDYQIAPSHVLSRRDVVQQDGQKGESRSVGGLEVGAPDSSPVGTMLSTGCGEALTHEPASQKSRPATKLVTGTCAGRAAHRLPDGFQVFLLQRVMARIRRGSCRRAHGTAVAVEACRSRQNDVARMTWVTRPGEESLVDRSSLKCEPCSLRKVLL